MKYLPEKPSFEHLRREARELRAKHRARDKSVFEIIGHYDTSFHGLSPEEVFSRNFSIIDAQRVTARQYCFASWRRLKLFVKKSTEQTAEYQPRLRKKLLRRNDMRKALIRRAKDGRAGSMESLNRFDLESQEVVRNIYERYGWPGPQVVGRDGTEACYWLAVSRSSHSTFQHACAEIMEKALPRGECYGHPYAITIDRWLCLSYRPQIYGSFNDFNEASGRVEHGGDVVDPRNLNKRRAEVGLPDIDAYNRELDTLATSHKWHRPSKSEWESRKRQWALNGGHIS